MADLDEYEIGDLVISEPPDLFSKPIFGLITKKEFDKRWQTWYYAIDWITPVISYKSESLLKYRGPDITLFKFYLKEWLDQE